MKRETNTLARAVPAAPHGSFSALAADGILLVDKPSGMTSHDVVDRIRRRFRFDKVGHAGTLDPQATGLLILMIGRGTKLANQLLAGDKVYVGAMRLGIKTDTQDADGKDVGEFDCSFVTRARLEEEIKRLTGDIMQVPPMVSAAKKNGVPLYKLARQGKTVERQPKLVRIHEFKLCEFNPPMASFRIHSSKGVYVRTLCADIGEALGCGAHLAQLRRESSGVFSLCDAMPLDALLALDRNGLLERMIPMTRVMQCCGIPS